MIHALTLSAIPMGHASATLMAMGTPVAATSPQGQQRGAELSARCSPAPLAVLVSQAHVPRALKTRTRALWGLENVTPARKIPTPKARARTRPRPTACATLATAVHSVQPVHKASTREKVDQARALGARTSPAQTTPLKRNKTLADATLDTTAMHRRVIKLVLRAQQQRISPPATMTV